MLGTRGGDREARVLRELVGLDQSGWLGRFPSVKERQDAMVACWGDRLLFLPRFLAIVYGE